MFKLLVRIISTSTKVRFAFLIGQPVSKYWQRHILWHVIGWSNALRIAMYSRKQLARHSTRSCIYNRHFYVNQTQISPNMCIRKLRKYGTSTRVRTSHTRRVVFARGKTWNNEEQIKPWNIKTEIQFNVAIFMIFKLIFVIWTVVILKVSCNCSVPNILTHDSHDNQCITHCKCIHSTLWNAWFLSFCRIYKNLF